MTDRSVTAAAVIAVIVISGLAVAQDAQDRTAIIDQAVWASGKTLYITHGPILGRPGPTSMGIWVRSNYPSEYRVLYGTQPHVLDRVTDPVPTALDNDNTGWVVLEWLEPETRYYYGISVADEVPAPQHRGSFKTLPSPERYRHPETNPDGRFNFSFHTAVGNRQHNRTSAPVSHETMLREIADEVSFGVHHGDWIYELGRDVRPAEWADRMDLPADQWPEVVSTAPAITGMWENYKRYLAGSRPLSRWHASVPHYFMFDDHEILNNVEGTTEPGFQARRTVLRDIALEAWYDYLAWSNPVADGRPIHFGRVELEAGSDILHDPGADFTAMGLDAFDRLHVHWGTETAGEPGKQLDLDPPADPNSRVYGILEVIDANHLRVTPAFSHDTTSSYSIGAENYFSFRVANVEFFVLDTRGQRDRHVPDYENVPGHSMLGERQKRWLKEKMTASDADFLVLVSACNVTIPHPGSNPLTPTGRGEESFMGYMAERDEMLDFWDGLSKPVLIFVGDLHNAYSIRAADNIWEFAACPLSSDNQHTKAIEGNRMANGVFDSAGREVQIRWSTFFLDDTDRGNRKLPVYAAVTVSNIFPNHVSATEERWVAYPHPQIVVRFYHGATGELLYAESVVAGLDNPGSQE